ncbi:hypothetical protein ACFOHS_10215 [Jhaorihella thermophila]
MATRDPPIDPAMAEAKSVLPLPGGPNSRIEALTSSQPNCPDFQARTSATSRSMGS